MHPKHFSKPGNRKTDFYNCRPYRRRTFAVIKYYNMFTIEQIKAAHGKMKSGADFPAYIAALATMGINTYQTMVADGTTTYYGSNGHTAAAPPRYAAMPIAPHSNKEQFLQNLKQHQQGHTDFLTFCTQTAAAGVEKWIVDIGAMTCTYYDAAGATVYAEPIPTV